MIDPRTRSDWLYATHSPSGEKRAFTGIVERTLLNAVTRPLSTDSVASETYDDLAMLKSSVRPSRDQHSGACDSPEPGLVKRTAELLPSAGCAKMAPSPSRSD